MALRLCILLLVAMAQLACVNADLDGKIGGLVFNIQSLALRQIPATVRVNNPNGVVPDLGVLQYVAVLSDQADVCHDMQQHILRKNSKQLQIAVARIDAAGLPLSPAEDRTYPALDLATLAFAGDALPPPLKTLLDGYSQASFFVVDEACNAPFLPQNASSGGDVTVTRYDSVGLLADVALRMGPGGDRLEGPFLAPWCDVDLQHRPPATCR